VLLFFELKVEAMEPEWEGEAQRHFGKSFAETDPDASKEW